MSYHVFIERAQNPGNTAQVAAAIAQRYGLPVEAISKRMAAGRFRVKANVDLPTAKAFAAELQKLGAVSTIVDAATGAPAPAAVTPPPQPRTTDEYASGLAAAYGGGVPSQDLGAIESGEFNLSSIDGADDLPVSYAEPVTPTPDAGSAEPASEASEFAPPADEFAPPSEDSIVDIDQDAIDRYTPVPRAPTPTPEMSEAQRFSQELAAQQPQAPTAEQTGGTAVNRVDLRSQFRTLFVERERVRFAAGIVLVMLLAWVPARIYWGSKVDAAQAELDVSLQETVTLAKTDDAVWTDFEDIVRKERDLAGSRLFNKRITAVIIWIGLGGILGFLYYRKIPWDDI